MIYLLWSGILFSTAVRAVAIAKLVILGIFVFNLIYFSIKSSSCSYVSNARYFPFNLIYFSIKSSISSYVSNCMYFIVNIFDLILALYTYFLLTSFLLHHLVYLNQQEWILIYQHLIYLLYFLNCLNYLEHFLIYHYLIYLHKILN